MKKKVLYVHHSGSLGGAPKSLAHLVERLDRTKFEATILMLKDGPAIGLLKSTGARVVVARNLFGFNGGTGTGLSAKIFVKNIIGAILTWCFAGRVLALFDPDIIHLNTTSLFLIARAARKRFPRVRIICHVREPLLENGVARILRRMNERYVDRFVAIDEFTRARLAATRVPCSMVYNPVDLDRYVAGRRTRLFHEKFRLTDDAIIITFLARIDPVNSVEELCGMAARIATDRPRLHFMLVGFRQFPAHMRSAFLRSLGNVPTCMPWNSVKTPSRSLVQLISW